MLALTILLFILIFGLIIFLHELGHYLVAKREGMVVKEFAFGFPPRLWSTMKNGTRLSLNLLPLGGYVSILGEEEASEKPGSFTTFSPWARLRVVVAGVVMNALLAWLLLTLWFWLTPLAPKIDAIAVAAVQEDSVAEQVGIKANDLIVSAAPTADSQAVTTFRSDVALREYTQAHKGESIRFVVRRNGTEQPIVATLGVGEVPLGVSIVDVGKEIPSIPWWQAPIAALGEMWASTVMTFSFFGSMIAKLFGQGGGQVSIDSVSGPVGIFTFLQQTVSLGAPFVVRFAGLISLAVGIFNILPLPALDGGRAVFLWFEGIFGKRALSHQVESWLHAAGFAVLILLILVVTYFDIQKL